MTKNLLRVLVVGWAGLAVSGCDAPGVGECENGGENGCTGVYDGWLSIVGKERFVVTEGGQIKNSPFARAVHFVDLNGGELRVNDVLRFSAVNADDRDYLLVKGNDGSSNTLQEGVPFKLNDAFRGDCLSALDNEWFTLGACAQPDESDEFLFKR